MKNALKKLKNTVGFTLAETLLAVLIMLLVSGIMAAGIPAARSAYERVVLASNADLLLSTTASYLRNELSAVSELHVENDHETIVYFNKTTNAMSKIYLGDSSEPLSNSDRTIKYQRYADTQLIPGKTNEAVDLISPKASVSDLYVTYNSVAYDPEKHILTFDKLQVKRRSGAAGLARRDEFSIWVLEY